MSGRACSNALPLIQMKSWLRELRCPKIAFRLQGRDKHRLISIRLEKGSSRPLRSSHLAIMSLQVSLNLNAQIVYRMSELNRSQIEFPCEGEVFLFFFFLCSQWPLDVNLHENQDPD